MSNIHAGAYLSDSELSEPYLPNKQPRACAFDMWAYYDESEKFEENSITFMDNTNINAECITMHSDSCSFDFDYITNVLESSSTNSESSNFVDTTGNGYNFEFATEIGGCDSFDESSIANVNIFAVLAESSDYHKESLDYLQDQTSNGMRSFIDSDLVANIIEANNINSININNEDSNEITPIIDENDDIAVEMADSATNIEIANDAASDLSEEEAETSPALDTNSNNNNDDNEQQTEPKSENTEKTKQESNEKEDNGDNMDQNSLDSSDDFESYPKQWPSNETLSLLAWLLVITVIITFFAVISCIIYQKFATYDFHRSIVGSNNAQLDSFEAYLRQATGLMSSKYNFLQAPETAPLMNLNASKQQYAANVLLMDDENQSENTPLISTH